MSPSVRLLARLRPLVERRRRLGLLGRLSGGWALGTALVWLMSWAARQFEWPLGVLGALVLVVGLVGAAVLCRQARRHRLDRRAVALEIEGQNPELGALLVTAVEQVEGPEGARTYLQQRVVAEALEEIRIRPPRDPMERQLAWVRGVHILAGLAFVASCVVAMKSRPAPREAGEVRAASGVYLSPGDTNVEKGQSLVVLARFGGRVPARVDLEIAPAVNGSRRLPLVKNLADPIFGGTIEEVSADFQYWLEYGGDRTPRYTVHVFEYPRLERADMEVTWPEYTGRPPQRTEDARRLTAVAGSRLDLSLQLNKPVAHARLLGGDKSVVPLTVEPGEAGARLRSFMLTQSQAYDLQLVDAEGRTNKAPARFVFEVPSNRVPQLRLAMPRGDPRPSSLEEIRFEGEVSDDFGVHAYGLAYTVAGGQAQSVEFGQSVPGGQKRTFTHLLALEELGVQPDQLITYHVWAEDTGPDGAKRRWSGDLFFAEVRRFDEVFRQGQSADESSSSESEAPAEGGGQTGRLAEIQKQIMVATWNLMHSQREEPTPQHLKDAPVVRDSQAEALTQAGAARDKAEDPAQRALWDGVTRPMEQARARLEEAIQAPRVLAQALVAEQEAYQALLKLQAREYQVARSRSRRSGSAQGDREAAMQPQLDQLELTESDSRYEQQRQAASPLSAERRESLQVLQRLQELARRQSDLNERLKELQAARLEARTEGQRTELQRQLKRLREEEQQMLAQVDELRQRMDRSEKASGSADERRRLDQVRDQVQNASRAMEGGAVPQALAAGTRAERDLKEMREHLRRQSASQFADDLRALRGDARALAREEEPVARQMDAMRERELRTLSDNAAREALQERLATQHQRMTNLIDRATRTSQEAESAEPLLSRQLHDALRQLSQQEARSLAEARSELLRQGQLTRSLHDQMNQAAERVGGQSLWLTEELVRRGNLSQASRAEQRSRAGIDQLRQGIEQSAEAVLGDDREALRFAQEQLDDLARQVRQEAEEGTQPGRTGQSGQTGGAETALTPGGQLGGRERSGTRPEGDGRGPVRPRPGGGVGDRGGPITGPDFSPWSDRLREVEDLVEDPVLRNELAAVRERARLMRLESKGKLEKPDWAVVRLQVLGPLVQVRDQIQEELARRQSREALVPLDRDPVPGRYSELVRQYYEELGKGRGSTLP